MALSFIALRQSLHPPMGVNTAQALGRTMNPMRVFILGARAESSLPPYVWSQLPFLFPSPDVSFQIFFIGPEVVLPQQQIPAPGAQPNQNATKRGFKQEKFGVPAFTLPVSSTLTLHSLQAAYREVHDVLGPFDPYNDVFFAFSPGFGFPTVPVTAEDSPAAGAVLKTDTVQLETNWHEDMKMILDTKCALFAGGFSPADVERDVEAMERVEGIKDQFEWLLHPGENVFASQRWEVAEFDPVRCFVFFFSNGNEVFISMSSCRARVCDRFTDKPHFLISLSESRREVKLCDLGDPWQKIRVE